MNSSSWFFRCALVPLAVLLCSLSSRGAVSAVMEGAEGRRAFDELGAYYADDKSKPDFGKALEELGSANAPVREAAGRYLAALFAQSFDDETNGRAEWRRQPFWGGGSESPAREFRKELGAAFAKDAHGDGALDAVLWLCRNEKLAEVQNAAVAVLPKIDSPRMEKVLAELLERPHPNAELAAKAVEETGRRRLGALAPRIVKPVFYSWKS